MKTRLISTLRPEFAFASFAFPKYVWTLPPRSLKARMERHADTRCTGDTYHSPNPTQAGKGCFFYLGSESPVSLRWEYCDEVEGVRIRHTGWFCDEYQDDKIRGIVARLPRGRGFLAGWTMGTGMASGWEGDVYETAQDAARAADSLAENMAEKEREYQERETQRLQDEENAKLEAALCFAE